MSLYLHILTEHIAMKLVSTNKELHKPSIGLCLGGGGALGLAHIGVIQALEDYNIRITEIAGSSMGSLIGVLYAAGYTPLQMLQFIEEGHLYRITKLMNFKPYFWNDGFANHTSITNLLQSLFPNNSTEKLNIPVHICVSNITNATWEIISNTKEVSMWVAASCSIPGIFKSMKINNMQYVDGGLLNNMPAQALRDNCNIVIGSDVVPHFKPNKTLKSKDTFLAAIRVVEHQNATAGRALCDFLIEPKAIDRFHELSFDAYKTIYQYGYRSVVQFAMSQPQFLASMNAQK